MDKSIERISIIDKEITVLESKLNKLNEERREIINYLNLNKEV